MDVLYCQNGIDGIFKKEHADGTVEYIIMDSKTKVNGIQPEKCNSGSKAGLCNTVNNGYQLSNEWILSHIGNSGLSLEDEDNIREALANPSNSQIKVTRYVARVSKNKVAYHEVTPVGDKDIGAVGGSPEITYNHTLKKW